MTKQLYRQAGLVAGFLMAATMLGAPATAHDVKSAALTDVAPVGELVGTPLNLTRVGARSVVGQYLKDLGKSRLRVGDIQNSRDGWKVTVTTLQRLPVKKYLVNKDSGKLSALD